MSTIRFGASLVEELKEVVRGEPARVDPRGFRVYGPLSNDRDHLVLVLLDDGVDDVVEVTGYKLPIPEEIGRGFLADVNEILAS